MKIMVGVVMLFLSACKEPLERAKGEVKSRYEKEHPAVLKAAVTDNLKIEKRECETILLNFPNISILLQKPLSNAEIDPRRQAHGYLLKYDKFKVAISPNVEMLGKLPPAWGDCDLTKLREITKASGKLIDDAATFDALKNAVALITARELSPDGAFARADWITSTDFEGLLTGDFASGAAMVFLVKPAASKNLTLRLKFIREKGGTRNDVFQLIRSIKFKEIRAKEQNAPLNE